MVAVDHEGGSELLKAPRIAWMVLDFFMRAMVYAAGLDEYC